MVPRVGYIIFHPVFLFMMAGYSLIRLARYNHFPIPEMLNSYTTDVLCIPLVLSATLLLARLIKRNHELKIHSLLILLICLEFSCVFEWILPAKSPIYTGDPLDVVMYFFGGGIFYLIQPLYKLPARAISN